MKYEEYVLLKKFSNERTVSDNIVSWDLANFYYKIGHYSPAIYFFSHCAENSPDELLSYECLLMMSLCFSKQDDKQMSRMASIDAAINLYPLRPEGFYLKSRCYLENGMYDDCIRCIDFAVSTCQYIDAGNGRNDQTVIISWSIEYFGKTHLKYIKGLAYYYKKEYKNALELFESIESEVATDLPQNDVVTYKKVFDEMMSR